MFETILKTTDVSIIPMPQSLICMGTALILGLVISICYMCTQKKRSYTKDFAIALTILPAVVAIVIILVGSNVARAFSIAGAFALVRFRSIPGNSKDIAVVFLTMAIGLATGLGYIAFGVMGTVLIVLVIVILSVSGFGENKSEEKLLRILIPESLNYKDTFKDIFDKYLNYYEMKNVKTTNMGSMFELQYLVTAKKDMDEKAFIDEIRCRNGNLNISLGMMPDKHDTML